MFKAYASRSITAAVILLVAGPVGAQHAHMLAEPGAAGGVIDDGRMQMHGIADPHMRMTAPRRPAPGDRDRAARLADETRAGIERYRDVGAASRDGYVPFGDGPDVAIVH